MKFLSFFLAFLLVSCAPTHETLIKKFSSVEPSSPDKKHLGVSVLYEELKKGGNYERTINSTFSSITPENAMKFEVVHPNPHIGNFAEADYIVKWGSDNNLTVRGHPIIWHRQVPHWLLDNKLDATSFREIFDSHILNIVSRYKDTVQIWDVVNEAINSDGSLRKSIWLKNLGPEYIKNAFILAHLANPKAKLFYNDYDISKPSVKSDAVYSLLKELLAVKIPIHGIGFQMHLRPDFMPTEDEIRSTFENFAELGLEINITELDIAIPSPSTENDRALQKQYFEMVARTCMANKACRFLTLWGLHDGVSWVPSHFKGLGEATLFDSEMKPKESYEGFIQDLGSDSTCHCEALKGLWQSHEK